MSLYVEVSRKKAGGADWETVGNAEVGHDGRTLTNLTIPEECLTPSALGRIGEAIARDSKPHPEEELADQLGTVSVEGQEYRYKTVFANPQVPGG
ncbi:MAG: hypothetical protein ABIT01_11495 [Thermoanaerobaculia bacterium]